MSNNSSTNGRLKGIYLRGKVFWHRYSYEDHQYRASLQAAKAHHRSQNSSPPNNGPCVVRGNTLIAQDQLGLRTQTWPGAWEPMKSPLPGGTPPTEISLAIES